MSTFQFLFSKPHKIVLGLPGRNLWSILITCLVISYSPLANAQFPAFEDGDTVCFVGNSITMNARFYNYLELFYATRFPERTIEFHNCGISGDVAGGVLARIESDILIHNPTWCVIMLGMNDIGHSLYSPSAEEGPELDKKRNDALERYYVRTDSVIRTILDSGSKVVLQTPTIYDQTAVLPTSNRFGANDALKQCADFIEQTAKKYKLPFVDYWTPMLKMNEKLQQKDPGSTIIGNDRVHPGAVGHFLMTSEFLKTQQPSDLVSLCQIDAKRNRILKSINCKIDHLKVKKNELSFDLLASSLPFPKIEKDFNVDSLLDFTNSYNREMLVIKSLRKGIYSLHIDDVDIGHFSDKQFQNGLNLAKYPQTPQNQQADVIVELFHQYWQLEKRLRRLEYIEMSILKINPAEDIYTLEEIKVRFAKKMDQMKGASQSVIDYFNRSFEAYLKDKPEQNQMKAKAKEVFQDIQNQRSPTTHKIAIHRTR